MFDKLGEQIDSYDYGPRRISPGERIERLERAVLLLARHVGATGWDKPLQDVLDEIESNLRLDGLW
jgi:hypothetical protein